MPGPNRAPAHRRPPERTPPASWPELDPDVSAADLDPDVRSELDALSGPVADRVARHLVMAGQLLDDEPARAHEHARAARQLAPRVAAVREALGTTSYATGAYAEALAELRTARRINGSPDFLAVMADCERGLGRPQRAIDMAGHPDAGRLDPPTRVELLIVVSGARRDLGLGEAAVVGLQGAELRSADREPWGVRLQYAYAEALLTAGRSREAARWFARAAAADTAGETDADERHLQLAAEGDRPPPD